MPLNNLTLHTRLTIGNNWNVKHIEVGEIALAVLKRFPNSFLPRHGTTFIRHEYGGLPKEFRPRQYGMGGFWQGLYEAGIARRQEIPSSTGGGYHHFAYEIAPETLQDYKAPAKVLLHDRTRRESGPQPIRMPTDRDRLLETFAEFKGLSLDEVIKMSEISILVDAEFQRVMEITRQVSHAEYVKCGGPNYDKLIQGNLRPASASR